MPSPSSGWPLLFACVVFVVLAGTASADAVGDGSWDAPVGTSAGLDTATPTPDDNTTLDGSVDANGSGGTVSAGVSTNGSDGTVSAGVSTNGTDADESLDATVNGTSGSVEANASAGDADATASVDASVDDTTVDAELDAVAVSVTESDEDANATDADAIVGVGEDESTTARSPAGGAAPGSDGGRDSGSGGPAGTAALGMVAAASGATTIRRGMSAAGSQPTLLTTASDTVAAVVHWLRSKLLAVVPLRYSRYDDSDPLEHEVRADLHDAVETAPGVHLSKLEGDSDVSLSSVRHHLRILEEESLIESERIRGKRRYFPANATHTALRAALEEPATASVLETLARVESATVSDLADRLGRDPSTVSHHLSRLEEDGLVVREREGPAVVSRLAEGSRRVLAAGEPQDVLATAD